MTEVSVTSVGISQRNNMNILDYVMFLFSEKELSIYRKRRIEMRTLDEVGRDFGITRERVRQVEAKIDEKIRTIDYELDIKVNKLL